MGSWRGAGHVTGRVDAGGAGRRCGARRATRRPRRRWRPSAPSRSSGSTRAHAVVGDVLGPLGAVPVAVLVTAERVGRPAGRVLRACSPGSVTGSAAAVADLARELGAGDAADLHRQRDDAGEPGRAARGRRRSTRRSAAPAHGGERERLRRAGVLAVTEGGDELACRAAPLVAQPAAAPAVGVVVARGPGMRRRVRERGAGSRSCVPGVDAVACAARRRPSSGASTARQHHRALAEAGRLERAALEEARRRRRAPARATSGWSDELAEHPPRRPRTGSTSTPGARGSRRVRCRRAAHRARRRRPSAP